MILRDELVVLSTLDTIIGCSNSCKFHCWDSAYFQSMKDPVVPESTKAWILSVRQVSRV